MKADLSLEEQIRIQEERLLEPEFRASSAEVASLLGDDFLEFGASGRRYDKNQVSDALKTESQEQISMTDFRVKALCTDVALATYRVVRQAKSRGQPRYSLRSSIWKLDQDSWRMVFHQATPQER